MTESNSPSPEPADEIRIDSSEDVPDSAVGSAWTGSGDDLPELEELTPELAEEEAIRGDFMLRGAAILLAVLFACGQIADSRVLVHIRSGDYMRANGFVPPRTDVLSISMEGQPTANVSWLFDHVVSLVWSLGGAQGLTVFKAAIAALIAWLLTRISVAGLPTWWNSICGVIAIAACASDLMPITDLMTLLGLIIVLRMLHNAFDGNVDGLIWKAPLTIAVWANLDPRAWLGVVALLLFSAGRTFAKVPGDTRPAAAPGTLWAATGVSAVSLLINPFPVASVLSVIQTYWVEYPAQRALNLLNEQTIGLLDGRTEYYSLFNDAAWGGFEFGYVAALMMIFIAAVAIVLSRDRREAPWTFVLIGFVVLAALSIHELAAAALVAAAAAGTAGQRWYQKTFPQEYTVKPAEVLFSRAGRAITVCSFALLGFLLVTDRVPTRAPVGKGFTDDLQTTMVALDKQFQQLPQEARVLHTTVELGDFLIWTGHKSYIDSRITPFGPLEAADSATNRYLQLRGNMRDVALAVGGSGQSGTSTDTANEPDTTSDLSDKLHGDLQQDGITHAVACLYPPGKPHYRTLGALSSDSESWLLTSLESSSAIFAYTRNSNDLAPAKPIDVIRTAFRDVEPTTAFRFEFAREKGFYDEYLYRSRPTVPEDLRVARHYLNLRETPATLMTAIRAANRLATRDNQHAEGFYVLALGYSQLANWESQVVQQTGGRFASDMRYMQIVMAARQAVTIDDGHEGAWNLLYRVYSQHGRVDQARECLTKALPSLERSIAVGAASADEAQQAIKQLHEVEQTLKDRVAAVEVQLAEAMQQEFSANPAEAAAQKHQIAENVAGQGQHLGAALELLQANLEAVKEAPAVYPRAETMRGRILLETGALQEGYDLLMQLNSMAKQQAETDSDAYPWTSTSFIGQMGLGDYENASERMGLYVSQIQRASNRPGLQLRSLVTLPLVASIETTLRSTAVTHWPLTQLVHCVIPMQKTPFELSEPRFMQAMAQLEGGFVDAARVNLQGIITEYGESPYRPLASVYLTLLHEDPQDFAMKNTLNTWEDWLEPEFETVPVQDSTTEEPTTEEPTTEEPATEEPATEEPATEEPTTEEPATEEPTTEEPTTEEPATEEPTTEEPTTEEPATEEPATEEPTTEEPATEEPATEEPATEEPATEEPATEEPTTESAD